MDSLGTDRATSPAPRTITVRLASLAGSGVHGTATLTTLGGATRISWAAGI